jgi:dihydrofolate reductase
MKKHPKCSVIVAVDINGAIGKDNDLLFSIPEDLKHFKNLTTNNIVVMGRRTWESLPVKPLPNRYNIVITTNPTKYQCEYDTSKVKFVHNIIEAKYTAMAILEDESDKYNDIFVIGGGEIYRQTFELYTPHKIYLTRVYKEIDNADTFFPMERLSSYICTEIKATTSPTPHAYEQWTLPNSSR